MCTSKLFLAAQRGFEIDGIPSHVLRIPQVTPWRYKPILFRKEGRVSATFKWLQHEEGNIFGWMLLDQPREHDEIYQELFFLDGADTPDMLWYRNKPFAEERSYGSATEAIAAIRQEFLWERRRPAFADTPICFFHEMTVLALEKLSPLLP